MVRLLAASGPRPAGGPEEPQGPEQPQARPWETARGGRAWGPGPGSGYRWPTSQTGCKGSCQLKDNLPPSAPRLGRGKGKDVRLGAGGSSGSWGGPTLRSLGSSSQVFQVYTEATFSCVGTRLGGGAGRAGGRCNLSQTKEGPPGRSSRSLALA